MTDILKKISEFNKTLLLINKIPTLIQNEINTLTSKVSSYRMALPDRDKKKQYIGILLYENKSLTNDSEDIETNKLNNFITLSPGNYIISYNIGFKKLSSHITASIGVKENNKVLIIKNSKTINNPNKEDIHLTCTFSYHTEKPIDLCVIINNNNNLNNKTFSSHSILSIVKI